MNDDQIKEIFHQALAKTPDARAEFLDRICGEAGAARERLDALLRAHAEVGSFLSEPEKGDAHDIAEGDLVDRYKLLQRIGEGGFGLVYMAEQTEPVQRKVALKVIKLGMDTRQVIARFEAERQALALMDHPNIARVLDAGSTAAGRPYFVMELVRGVPITEYCDQARLDTAARLQLFQLVCGAVQHAHQKGVIHRDLKPSNILVTMHDGRPVPKVIDFGIAKAIDRPLTEKTLFTEFRQMIGTPEYMAPEQAEMSGLDVDTRADIYSLGVPLYELLTSKKPFEIAALMQRGYEEVLRTIREVDPPKPSTRVSSMGEEIATVASCRHTVPRLLGRLLRGDLDWIVMKALEKDRTRRYDTAAGLAMDIDRYLSNDAVLASPPGATYRIRKFVRRHRVGVVAGGIVAIALCAGLTLATFGILEARAERDRARTEATRANTVSALLESLFQTWEPGSIKGANYPARALLDDFDLRYGEGLSDDPEVEAQVRRVIGRAYRALGVADRAEPHLRAAYRLGLELYGDDSRFVADNRHCWAMLLNDRGDYRGSERAFRDVLVRLDRIEADSSWRGAVRRSLADVLQGQGRFDEATAEARRALEIADSPEDRAQAKSTLAWVLHATGEAAEAESLLRDALAWTLEARGDNHPSTCTVRNQLGVVVMARNRHEEAEQLFRKALAGWEHAYGHADEGILRNLARLLAIEGRVDESALLCARALESARARLGPNHRRTALALVDVADIHRNRNDFPAAKAAYESAIGILRSNAAEGTLDHADALRGLAQVLEELGEYEEAARIHREVLRLRRKFYGERHAAVSAALHNLACTLEQLGEMDEALTVAREAVAMAEAVGQEDEISLSTKLNSLGILLMHARRFDESERVLKRSLELRRRHLDEKHVYVATSLNNLAVLYDERAHAQHGLEAYREAKRAYEEALALWIRIHGDDHLDVALTRSNLGALEVRLGDFEAARAHLEAALEIRRRRLGPDHPDVALVLFHLGDMYVQAGNFPEARKHLEEALRRRQARLGEGHPETSRVRLELGRLELRLGRFTEAIPFLRTAREGYRKATSDRDPQTVEAAIALGLALQCTGKEAEGRVMVASALSVAEDRATAASDLNTMAWQLMEVGRLAVAEPASRSGLEYARSVYGDEHEATADHEHTLASILLSAGRPEEAEPLTRRALETRRARLGEKNGYVVSSLATLGTALEGQGRFEEAEKLVREAIALSDEVAPDGLSDAAGLYVRLGGLRQRAGDLDDAERNLREALTRYRGKYGPNSIQQSHPLRGLASILEARGDNAGAEKMYRAAHAILRDALGPRNPQTLDAQAGLALHWMNTGRAAEAIPVLEQVLSGYEETMASTSPQVLWARLFVAQAYMGVRSPEKAEPLLIRNVDDLRRHHGIDNDLFLQSAGGLAHLYHVTERHGDAARVRRELVPVMRKLGVPPVPLADELARFGWNLLSLGKYAEAEPVAREVLRIRDEHLPDGDWLRFSARCFLGRSLAGQRKFEEAETMLLEGLAGMNPPPKGMRAKQEALDAVVAMYEAWGKPEKAAEWRRRRESAER